MLGKHPTCAAHSSKREGQSSSLLSQMMAFILEGQALFIIFPWLTNSQNGKSSHHDKRIQVSRGRQYLVSEWTMQLEGSWNYSHLVLYLCSERSGEGFVFPKLWESATYPRLYLFEEGVHSVRIIALAICDLKSLACLISHGLHIHQHIGSSCTFTLHLLWKTQ